MAELVAKHADRFATRAPPADERRRRDPCGDRPGDQAAAGITASRSSPTQRPTGGRAEILPVLRKNGRAQPADPSPSAPHEQHGRLRREERSKFLVYTNSGWPYESSAAMARLAFGGVLERFPTLKIVTHHAGGMIPYLPQTGRTVVGLQRDADGLPPRRSDADASRRSTTTRCSTATPRYKGTPPR